VRWPVHYHKLVSTAVRSGVPTVARDSTQCDLQLGVIFGIECLVGVIELHYTELPYCGEQQLIHI
jgi:hypothetical protein